MLSYKGFLENCQRLEDRIETICSRCGRNRDSIYLMPVTKNQPPSILEYVARYGFSAIAENRVQEAIQKQRHCDFLSQDSDKALQWDLIGHLQTNKINLAIKHFDRIQTVDSLKLLEKLNAASGCAEKNMRILLQMNVAEDPAKFGLSCDNAKALLEKGLHCDALKIEGLMTIAPFTQDKYVLEKTFNRLRELRDNLEATFSVSLFELSMGMSNDFEAAILAGSTLIRIGTALFGSR